jgi:hypothetical protein
MKHGRILGALIACALVISTAARNNHLLPSTSDRGTAGSSAETLKRAERPAVDPQTTSAPGDLLQEHETQMALVPKTCGEFCEIERAAREGPIGIERTESGSDPRLESGILRLQFLDSLHQILDDRSQKEAKQKPEVQSSGDTLIVPAPDSSPDLSPAIVKYLELTPGQIAAIQWQIEKERDRVRALAKRLARNRRARCAVALEGRFDVRQARDLAAEQSRIRKQLMVANARLQIKAYQILTVEQQRKLDGVRRQGAGLTHPSLRERERRFDNWLPNASFQSPSISGERRVEIQRGEEQ